MKPLKISAFVLALVACAPLAAFAQSAAGNWDLTIDTPQGANTVNVSLTQAGNALTGTLSSPMGAVDLKGTATGADVVVVADIDAGGTPLTLTFTGKIEGDAFNGNVKFGDFGEGPFTGRRAASKAAVSPAAAAPPAAAPAATTTGAASAGSISGKWDVMLNIPGAGEIPISATVTQAAEKVSGTISSQVGGDVPFTGTMTGNALKIEFTAQTQNGDIPVTMTGTLAAGVFAGKATIAGMGEADWTGKRAQ